MPKTFKSSDLWSVTADRPLLDVRTPAEHAQGHIPRSGNLPLFTNAERAEVGTLYKQVSPGEAFKKGLEYAGARMRWYVEEAERKAPQRKLALHCWRGGQRSESLAWLLGKSGFDVMTLEGGYKAYRRHIREQMEHMPLRLLVLGGQTGSGKTHILHKLASRGEQMVDLEGLAHHKGSAFGALGEAPQPTNEQYENDFFDHLLQADGHRRLWVENESRSIGRVIQPEVFWNRFVQSTLVEIVVPFEERVAHLVQGYGKFDVNELAEAFLRIKKRLGGQHLKGALEALRRNDLEEAAAIALRYYDKAYRISTERTPFSRAFKLEISGCDEESAAQKLMEFADANDL